MKANTEYTINNHLDAFLNGKRKYLSVVAGYMVNLMMGGYIGVGNIIPYLASYLTAMELDDDATSCTDDIRSRFSSNMTLCNWMLSALCIGYASFGTIGGVLSLYISTRMVTLLGGSMLVASFLITWAFSSNVYVIMFCSFGVMFGAGAGIMWSPAIICSLRWFPQSKALVNGILLSAATVGGIGISIVETEHINPSNVYNDPGCGYALHPEVVGKVPGIFAILAVMVASCILIAFLCMFDKPPTAETEPEEDTKSIAGATSTPAGTTPAGMSPLFSMRSPALSVAGSTFGGSVAGSNAGFSLDSGALTIDMMAGAVATGTARDFTVSEALRTPQFWVICGNLMLAVFTISFVYSDWKLLAQSYFLIGDDQFLLSLNTAAAVCGILGRFFWGAYYDHTASYKVASLTLATVTLVTVSTLPLCPAGNKAMVTIWICMLWFCVSAGYTLFPPALADNFGDKYCGVLMGFIVIAETVATLSQSSFFAFFQSSGLDSDTIWTSLCLEQAVFAALMFVITARFKGTKRALIGK